MVYATERDKIGRISFQRIDIDLPKCALTYGVGTCTAGRTITGTADAGSDNTITLDGSASAVDDAYNNQVVYISGGTGAGQERTISDYVGATKVATVTENWTTNPDATSTYTIIDRPNACYNTRNTCQDVPNYDGSALNTITFCDRGIAIPGYEYLPLLEKSQLSASKIFVDKALGRRGQMTLGFRDAYTQNLVDDAPLDPYWATRTYTAQGSFWRKFKAIYKYYQSSELRLKTTYLADPYDPTDSNTRTYILDEITGPDKSGRVTLKALDILKLADDKRAKCPAPTTGYLAASLTAASTSSFTLTDGAGQYDAAGYIRIGDEVIQYTSGSDSGSDFTIGGTITRGAYNTTASAHDAGDNAQLCYELNSTNIVDFLDALLFTFAGITASYKDTTGWANEKSLWFVSTVLSGLITEPTGVTKLIEELQQDHAIFNIWWDDVNSKIKLKAVSPVYGVTTSFTDSANLLEVSNIKEQPDQRVTRIIVYYDPINPLDVENPENYKKVEVKIDANAESSDQYGDERAHIAFARFLTTQGLALQFAGRKLARFRDPPTVIEAKIDAKDTGTWLGDNVNVETRYLQDVDGSKKTTLMKVAGVQELTDKVSGTFFKYTLLDTVYQGRYARIMSASAASEYSSASESEKSSGCYIAASGGADFSDGGEAYKIP